MDAFDNPLAAPAEVEQWAKPNLYSKSVEELQELSRAIGVPEIDIEEASAKPDATEALADLIAPRTVSHHFREWAIICSHEEALGADKATGKPEVMVTELEERLRSLGLQVEGHPTPLQTEYILQISAPEDTLRFWATRMGLLMRLKGDPTKNRRHAEFGGSKSLAPRARVPAYRTACPRSHSRVGCCPIVVPFKDTKAQEFQANKHPHHEYSIFDSGARQRIVRYIMENDVDGIDLDDSVDSKAEYHRQGLLKSVASAGVGAIGGVAHEAASGAMKVATAVVEHSSVKMRRIRDSVDEAVVEHDDAVAPGSATTVWVGGLPENCADDPAVVTDALKVFGQVLSVTVRAKPGHCKSWAFATFVDQASHAQAASAGSLTVADGAGKAVTLTLKAAKVDKELKKEETGALATMWAGQEQKLVAATPIPSTGMELRTPRGAGADNEEGETHGGVTRALKRTLTRTLSRNPSSPITLHHTGNKRVWPCINDFLPLNDTHELNFLVSTWAHPRLVIETLRSRPKRERAAFGPSGEETFLNSITTQPIEEIRDYFGEQIALYFAFLRVYTNSLVFPTVIGMLTMIGHLRNGVEGNPLSLAYSILVSFWSVAFIKKWHIRQAELCFLWGTSTFEENEKTRKNFRLKEREIKYEVDEFTGKNEPVPKNPRMVYYRTAASVLVGTFFIFTVVVAALSAEYVRMLSKPNQLGKYSRVVGSSLNACAILILSQIYGRVANVLTEWENHRVQTAFEDAMIL
eukprot:COSAG03_NODE_1108_length_4802_cov_1359.085903_2_plen_749_part_00